MQLLCGWGAGLPHYTGENIHVVVNVDNGKVSSGPPSPFSKSVPASLRTHPFSPVNAHTNDPLKWCYEPGFHLCSNIVLMCSCILPGGINAPETIRANGRLSSNVVCELLISHRVKSRTLDLRVLQCRCLCWCWLCQQRKTSLCLTPVGISWQNSEKGHLCRTSKQCILCIGQVLKHSPVWSLTLVSSQLSKKQILPLNDVLRLVFEWHWGKNAH